MPGSHGWAVLQEKMYVHDGEALLGHLEGVDDRNGVASEGVQTGGSRSPLPAYASGLYPLSALPKEPPSQDPSRDSIHYPGGTVYAWYPLPRGKPLHPGLTYGGPPSGRTSVPDKTPYRPPFPAPFGSVVCPLRGVFTPAAPLRTRRPPPSFPTQKQDFRWTPSPQAGLPPSPPPPPAALRCPLRLRRAG
ncbi:hypothetical protein ACRRTK_023762 [Alexandromys fortis]